MPYRPVSSIWKNDISTLTESFDQWWTTLQDLIPGKGCDVFFRADDIGYPGRQFSKMIDVFSKHQTPLALAVVPAWLNEQRAQQLLKELELNKELWCLHQHGYRHVNLEKEGKKFEFGPSRNNEKIIAELTKGQQKLSFLLKDSFCPFFTPPWNRCSSEAMHCLADLGFVAISRSINVSPRPLDNLPDIPINVDLHTIKEIDPATCIKIVQSQIEEAVKTEYIGFMLHHQRMNKTSQLFLDYLLEKVNNTPRIRIRDIREMPV